MIGSGPILRGGIWSGHRAGIEPMNPTTRRRLFQVLLALVLLALVIVQGLMESNPNH